MIHFVGAGPGAADLITVRGAKLLSKADQIIYAGSLVNPELLSYKRPDCRVLNSASMTLEQVTQAFEEGEKNGWTTVRLHTGDPSIYGAVREQMDELEGRGISFDSCPGVSSFCGAAAALNLEYTLPGISQSVVITRMEGRTPVPERERIASFCSHRASMVIFLSTGLLEQLEQELVKGGFAPDTPAAIVYKASWPDEKVVFCTIGTLKPEAERAGIRKTALIIVGEILRGNGLVSSGEQNGVDRAGENEAKERGYERSKLYDPLFTTEFRQGSDKTKE